MKTLGIIGGIGPESTIDYYRFLIEGYRRERPDGRYPPLLIRSIDLNRMVGYFGAGDLEAVTRYLIEGLHSLANGGADLAILAANTPHIVFGEVSRLSPIPLVSIVEATCRAVQKLGLQKPALFGTRFTMSASFYPAVFAREGIVLAIPDEREQSYIHEKYMTELINGIILPESRSGLLEIVAEMRARDGIDSVILGGTELPLILRDVAGAGVPFLDTTRIHVEAALREMLA